MILEDVHNIITEEIGKLPGEKKYAGDTVMVCCPFHDDSSPSCGIYTSVGMEIPLGFFHCFGCGAKGPWNKLAEQANLRDIPGWAIQNAAENSVSGLAQRFAKLVEPSTTYRTLPALMRGLARTSYVEWPDDTEWRTYPGSLVKAAGGQMTFQRTGTSVCFFPCTAGKKYIGGIAAYLTKQMNGTSYVNSTGDWAKDKGLFPLALTQHVIDKYDLDYVVLVEGPRDALGLISCGIPALAVLGSEQFGEKKMRLIERLEVKHIYTMSDNDSGGKTLRNNIKQAFRNSPRTVKHFKLPREFDKKGKLIKMDPDNAPQEIIKEVRATLRARHGKGCFIPARRLGWNRANR